MKSQNRPKLLFVDDDPVALDMMKASLQKVEFEPVAATNPLDAVRMLLREEVAVIISDYVMPVINGLELIALTKRICPHTTCILMNTFDDIRKATEDIDPELIDRVVAKEWKSKQFKKLIQEAVELYENKILDQGNQEKSGPEFLRKVNRQAGKAVLSIALAVDGRDTYTHYHSQNVATYSMIIGRTLGFEEEALGELCVSALVHDVGKLSVPDEVLLKPGKLSTHEFEFIKKHPTTGASLVKPIRFSNRVADIIHQHHENLDGSGYPGGIQANQIEDLAKIIRVADAFDGMSADRLYHQALSNSTILEWFRTNRGHQFEPEVIDVLIAELESGRLTTHQFVGFPSCYLSNHDECK